MKYIAILLLLSACYVQAPTPPPQQSEPVMIECTITGTSTHWDRGPETWVTDTHGHRGSVRGICGAPGDKIMATCDNGRIN